MTEKYQAPAKNPCGSCPYRCDTPSGVWDASEYEKLPAYDRETFAQPTGVFLCHQVNGSICSGWAGTHDMDHSLAVRMATLEGRLTGDVLEAVLDYQTDVPLFATGAEAAAHGTRDLDEPGDDAQRTIEKMTRKRAGTTIPVR